MSRLVRWWGPVALEGAPRKLRIGPLHLRLARGRLDLRVEAHYGGDPSDVRVVLDDDEPMPAAGPASIVRRFALPEGPRSVVLAPVLADLAVVSRPEHAFSILPGDEAVLFVGSPVFLRLEVTAPDEPERRLFDIPLTPLRHTWFGTADEGQLAYASRTYCRLHVDEVPRSPHRAYTAMHLQNAAATPLDLERLLVPVPNLSLGVDESGRFWTDDLHLTRSSGDPYAPLEPAHGRWLKRRAGVDILGEPRAPSSGPSLLRLLAPVF